ncbi:condensation domain-containing protein, partial [Escherichia coli]|uniref:condensation domain-containing protein n=1 Tax=Escherichia coli TaxID=562 RepID=UPI002158372D
QTLFVYQNAQPPLPRLRDLELLPFDNDQATARFDLTLICSEAAAGLRVALDYNADLFEVATADRLLRLFAHLLAQGVAEPGRPVGELPLLDEAEHLQVVLACNATAQARAEDDLCLHGLVARQAARTPEAPA